MAAMTSLMWPCPDRSSTFSATRCAPGAIPDRAPEPHGIPRARVAAFDEDTPRGWRQQPIDELQDGRLAGSAPSDERQHFAGVDRHGEAIEESAAPRGGVRDIEKFDGGRVQAVI